MFKLIKSFFILAVLLGAVPLELLGMTDYEPIQKDIKTLTQWSNRCFKELVEKEESSVDKWGGYCGTKQQTISVDELQNAFQAFIQKWKPIFEDVGQWKGSPFTQSKRDTLFGVPSLTPLQENSLDYFAALYPFVQKKVISADSQVCFIGDLHGSVHSLLRNVWRLVHLGWIGDDFKLTQKNRFIVFNGDFVDRGAYGVECIYTLLRLKLANWDNVFLLRGNHESMNCMSRYGFLSEVKTKYKIKSAKAFKPLEVASFPLLMLLQRFNELLPFALYLGAGKDAANGNKPNFVQCCHGGIETGYDPKPLLDDSADMKFEVIPEDVTVSCCSNESSKTNNYAGFNWSDFEQPDYSFLRFNTVRGAGYVTGPQGADVFLNDKKIKAFFRGHQDKSFGFKMLFKNQVELNTKKTALGATFNAGDYGAGPFWWKYVVGDAASHFQINNFTPVFTFTTAAEGQGVPYDCFGILNVAEKYENWDLTPHEYPLYGNSNDEFNRKRESLTIIDVSGSDCIVGFFNPSDKWDNGDGTELTASDAAGIQTTLAQKAIDNISFKKPAAFSESVLSKSLTTLQASLGSLKAKLELLKAALQKLKGALKI